MYAIKDENAWNRFSELYAKRSDSDTDLYKMTEISEMLTIIAQASEVTDGDFHVKGDLPISFFDLWEHSLNRLEKRGGGYNPGPIPPEFFLNGECPVDNANRFTGLTNKIKDKSNKLNKGYAGKLTPLTLFGVPDYQSMLWLVRLFYVSSSLYQGLHER